jgi:predicted phage terminase large subunit-like protein
MLTDMSSTLEELQLLRKLLAVEHHIHFIDYVWQNPSETFVVGQHTRRICTLIDEAIDRFQNGESSFYLITIPFRHGKSEILSRKLPPHFLGLFPDCKVILCGHTAELTEGFSKEARDLIGERPYRELFPHISVSSRSSSASHWHIHNHEGECFASGLSGSLAGQGYHLGLLDDFCSRRADAESETIREKTWDSFTNNFMTRRAPVSITIVLATPWHTDDIIARIHCKMKDEPNFPQFTVVKMPAFSDDYPSGMLFPERFDKKWYDEQRATLGTYGTAGLLQCDPVTRGGNLLNTDCIQQHQSLDEYPDIRYYRVWDLAHTAKERTKSDPDYTSGTLLGMQKVGGVPHLWIKDVRRMQKDAPERDKAILAVTEADGQAVQVGIESSIDNKDAYRYLSNMLWGKRVVVPVYIKNDKVVRVTPLEPLFQAGNVHVPTNAAWLPAWIHEVSAFPSGAHDDQVDNLSAGYMLCNNTEGAISRSPISGL